MTSFTDWLARKGLSEDFGVSPVDKFRFNDEGRPRDYEKDFRELSKVLLNKYYNEFAQFVKRLGDERGDDEIKDLLDRIQLEKKAAPAGDWQPRHPKDNDIISVPTADRGADPSGE